MYWGEKYRKIEYLRNSSVYDDWQLNEQLIILLVFKDIDVYSESKLEIVSPDYKMYDLFLIVALLYEFGGVLITSHSKHNIKVL